MQNRLLGIFRFLVLALVVVGCGKIDLFSDSPKETPTQALAREQNATADTLDTEVGIKTTSLPLTERATQLEAATLSRFYFEGDFLNTLDTLEQLYEIKPSAEGILARTTVLEKRCGLTMNAAESVKTRINALVLYFNRLPESTKVGHRLSRLTRFVRRLEAMEKIAYGKLGTGKFTDRLTNLENDFGVKVDPKPPITDRFEQLEAAIQPMK